LKKENEQRAALKRTAAGQGKIEENQEIIEAEE